MKINVTEECTKNSLVSHFILNGLTDALLEAIKKDSVNDVGAFCDFKILINDTEIEFRPFLDHWQSQITEMIDNEAPRGGHCPSGGGSYLNGVSEDLVVVLSCAEETCSREHDRIVLGGLYRLRVSRRPRGLSVDTHLQDARGCTVKPRPNLKAGSARQSDARPV